MTLEQLQKVAEEKYPYADIAQFTDKPVAMKNYTEAIDKRRDIFVEGYTQAIVDLPIESQVVNMSLRQALKGLLSLGRKDTSNPKYDGYYKTAEEAIAL